MQKDYDTIRLEPQDNAVLLAILNRPEAANAFNTHMARDLAHLFEELAADPNATRAVVLTGAGERAFCAGADLKERKNLQEDAWARQHAVFERMTRAILDCPIPVIGAVNGAAYGGGCEIVGMTDFAYASESARFRLPETRLGLIPGAGGTQTMARAMGSRRAQELILTGRVFSAAEAMAWGLINRVCPPGTLLAEALSCAGEIATNAPIAVRQARQAIQRGLNMALADGLAFEIEAYNRTVPTADRKEGVLAFNEKRKPVFRGE